MRFNGKLLILLIVLFTGCKEQIGGINQPNQTFSPDEILSIANQVTFQIKVSDGESILFSPMRVSESQTLGNPQYSDLSETNYIQTDRSSSFVADLDRPKILGTLNAEFDGILKLTSNFQYVLITSFAEIAEEFPELNISPIIYDYRVGYGLGSNNYDVGDIVSGEAFQVTDYLVIYSPPQLTYAFGYFVGTGLENTQYIYPNLDGFIISESDEKIESRGDLIFTGQIRGSYSIILRSDTD